MQADAKTLPRFDPIVAHLLLLTFSTGLVDALSVLSLGHVFTANMTGNVVFLGFALAGWPQFSAELCAISLVAFLSGAIFASRLTFATPPMSASQLILRSVAIEFGLQLLVLLVLLSGFPMDPKSLATCLAVACLAAAMGARNAIARKLAIPDLTTTVLTLTLTGIASDSSLAGGSNPRFVRRLSALISMFSGAILGAFLVAAHKEPETLACNMSICAISALWASQAWKRVPSETAGH